MVRTSLNNKHLFKKGSGKRDRLSSLPDNLLCQILSNLSTEESVRTSVLSKCWRNLWMRIPILDLDMNRFPYVYEFIGFFQLFLQSNKDLDLNRFKLIYNPEEHYHDFFVDSIDRVCHLNIVNQLDWEEELVRMPLSLYSCSTLVSLNLVGVVFDHPETEQVPLPCLKTMYLEGVKFDGDVVLESLISGCLVLEDLTMVIHSDDDYLEVVCVGSQSLKSFTLESRRGEDCEDKYPNDHDVIVDAPSLECMDIIGYKVFNFIVDSISPYSKVNIDVEFDEPSYNNMIGSFFTEISTVGEMIISARTLEIMDVYSEWGTLPQFGNLTQLHASFCATSWDMLQSLFCCCPNLYSLVLEFDSLPEIEQITISSVPPCFGSSLKFVQMTTPLQEKSNKKKLVIYFLRNCKVLKELTLNGSFRNIIKAIRLTDSKKISKM